MLFTQLLVLAIIGTINIIERLVRVYSMFSHISLAFSGNHNRLYDKT